MTRQWSRRGVRVGWLDRVEECVALEELCSRAEAIEDEAAQSGRDLEAMLTDHALGACPLARCSPTTPTPGSSSTSGRLGTLSTAGPSPCSPAQTPYTADGCPANAAAVTRGTSSALPAGTPARAAQAPPPRCTRGSTSMAH